MRESQPDRSKSLRSARMPAPQSRKRSGMPAHSSRRREPATTRLTSGPNSENKDRIEEESMNDPTTTDVGGLSPNAFSSLFQAINGLRNRRALIAMLGCMVAG